MKEVWFYTWNDYMCNVSATPLEVESAIKAFGNHGIVNEINAKESVPFCDSANL